MILLRTVLSREKYSSKCEIGRERVNNICHYCVVRVVNAWILANDEQVDKCAPSETRQGAIKNTKQGSTKVM